MKKLAFALLVGAAFVTGCGEKKEEGGAASGKPADSAKPATTAKAADSGKPADKAPDKAPEKAADKAADAGGGDVGIAECDEYIKMWKDCYKDPAMKAAAQPGFDALVKGWKDAAAQGGPAKDALKMGCKQQVDAFPKAACK